MQSSRLSAHWPKLVPYLLALVPPTYLVIFLIRYHLDVPYLDQWEFVPFLEKSYEGALSFRDFWAQHNEHRLVFPRLVMLVLARLSGWNIGWELATSVVLAAGTFVVLLHQVRQTAQCTQVEALRWAIPITSLLVFSMSQWQNWFLGWQLQVYMNVLCIAAAVVLLSHPKLDWPRFSGALILGIVATHSFANGMLLWIIGLLPLWFAPRTKRPTLAARLAVWISVSLLVACSYFYGYHRPSYHPPLTGPLDRPVEYAAYILKYLGAPIVNFNPISGAIMGAMGLAWFVASPRFLARKCRIPLQTLAPYIALGLYALLSAAITGLARLGNDTSDQALSSRYITISSLLWIANVVFMMLLAGRLGVDATRPQYRMSPWTCTSLLMLLVMVIAFNARRGSLAWLERYRDKSEARHELLYGDNDALLRRFHPVPQVIRERREFLRTHRLAAFGNESQKLR